MPRVTFSAPDAGRVLAECGGKQQVNRRVEPTIFLTTLVTLGIVGVCPTKVSWQADVVDRDRVPRAARAAGRGKIVR